MKKNKRRNINFIVITLVFIGGLAIFNFFFFNNSSPEFDILNKEIIYKINEDSTVKLLTYLNLRAKDQKSFSKLKEGFRMSDIEKKKKYQDFLNNLEKKSERDLSVISYSSTVTSNGLNIQVREIVKAEGFMIDKDDYVVEFSLPNQRVEVGENTSLNIEYPKGWSLVEANPTPIDKKENTLVWNDVGQIDFPTVTFEK